MPKKVLILALVLYLTSSIVSYFSFRALAKQSTQVAQQESELEGLLEQEEDLILDISPDEKKTEACPLNGKLFTKTEKEAWEKRRPLAVMIENHPDSRPQSGFTNSDIVFEAIAEGGVTRFMGMYYCDAQRKDIELAPIRSARTYFINFASGFYWPLYVHVGGANLPGLSDALGQLSDYGWVGDNDLNQFSIGYPVFVRDYNRLGKDKDLATEHTMVTSTEKLWQYAAEEREWTNLNPDRRISRSLTGEADWNEEYEGWSFEDKKGEVGEATTVSYDFWSGYDDYSVKWEYNPETNAYRRFMANQPHIDLNNDQQIEASNVIVFLTDEKGPINEKKHMLYRTEGTGKALVFKNGQAINATWNKKTRESELSFTDSKGKDLKFARGLTWVSVIDKGNEVSY
ncbi:MAG: DUF3048 domain-containing protein [Patescibacteria group bacterium]